MSTSASIEFYESYYYVSYDGMDKDDIRGHFQHAFYYVRAHLKENAQRSIVLAFAGYYLKSLKDEGIVYDDADRFDTDYHWKITIDKSYNVFIENTQEEK